MFVVQVLGKAKKDYSYPDRKGALGPMPATGAANLHIINTY